MGRMSEAKAFSFFVALLLVCSSIAKAGKPLPSNTEGAQQLAVDWEKGVEGCEGLGKEDCLARRTLEAHVDYIYTQGKPNN